MKTYSDFEQFYDRFIHLCSDKESNGLMLQLHLTPNYDLGADVKKNFPQSKKEFLTSEFLKLFADDYEKRLPQPLKAESKAAAAMAY